jgi:cytochrome c oxidase subunit 3
MSTPFSTNVRPDTGLYNAKLGLWLFLAAEAMFLGALFSSYAFLRTASESWPDGADILPLTPALLAAVACALAAASGARAWSTLKREDGASRRWIWIAAITALASAIFIVLGLRMEIVEGMTPATNTFYACWYLISALVAAHAAAAGVYTLTLLWPGAQTEDECRLQLQNRVECLGLFLQFVALGWFATFACFYVV